MLPSEVGLEMERAAFTDCLDTTASAALLHAARIEKRPLAPGVEARTVERIAVLGAEQGTSLAVQALVQGLAVDLLDADGPLLDSRREVIVTVLEGDPGADLARLSVSTELERCRLADLVVVADGGEAGAEYLRLAGLAARPGAVIAALDPAAPPWELTARATDTVAVHWPRHETARGHTALASPACLPSPRWESLRDVSAGTRCARPGRRSARRWR